MEASSNATNYIIVSGVAGSGKTTLARQISAELNVPMISKDTIKEAIGDTYDGEIPVQLSKQTGRATFKVLYDLAREARGVVVLESLWHPDFDVPKLQSLPGDLIEVHCSCGLDLARQRYINRASNRHPVHTDDQRADDGLLWAPEASRALGIDPDGIEVNTDLPVDVGPVVESIRAHPRWSDM